MESVDGRWYVFILEAATGTVLAHPANVYVGQDLTVGSEAYGDAGYYYAGDLIKATPEGIFVRDVLGVPTRDEQNPFHTIEEVKHYYAVLENGLIFASGWYTPAPTKEAPAEYARLLVGRALTRYDDTGREATLAHYNDPRQRRRPVVRLHHRRARRRPALLGRALHPPRSGGHDARTHRRQRLQLRRGLRRRHGNRWGRVGELPLHPTPKRARMRPSTVGSCGATIYSSASAGTKESSSVSPSWHSPAAITTTAVSWTTCVQRPVARPSPAP